MKHIKQVLRFCVRHSIILLPLLFMNLLSSVIGIFDTNTYDSNIMDNFIAYGSSLSNSDKVATLINAINAMLFEGFSHSAPFLIYYIISYFVQTIIVFGMVIMAFENGFSVLEDCLSVIKRNTLKVLKANGVIILLFTILSLLVLTPFCFFVNSLTDSDWTVYIFPVVGYVLFYFLMVYFLTIWCNYTIVAFIVNSNSKKALSCFFKNTFKCWLAAIPVIILLDILTLIVRIIFSSLDFLPLFSALNNNLIDSLSTFIITVWIVMIFYDKNRIDNYSL